MAKPIARASIDIVDGLRSYPFTVFILRKDIDRAAFVTAVIGRSCAPNRIWTGDRNNTKGVI